ncbi:MAG: UDP-glucuronic acid decarboxylase family protein [Chlamydiota bacterium]
MRKSALVTGGAGFLGVNLCKTLLALDYTVICVDNFCTGSKKNIEELLEIEAFSCIEHDVIDPLHIEVEEIFNFACPASPKNYQKDPLHTIRTSVLGSWNLLELAKKTGAKIFQASTSEIYGDPTMHPQTEAYFGSVNPIGKRACYDEGKRMAETLFFEYHRLYKVPMCVARIFNTYGPGMQPNDGRVISNFIMQALRNQPITLYGDGLQTRSFCYVDDLIKGVVYFMQHRACVGPMNLGNPQEITMLELARVVIELTDSKSSIIYQSLPEDDPRQRNPSIDLAIEKLSWHPTVSLEEGLLKTIHYFRKFL